MPEFNTVTYSGRNPQALQDTIAISIPTVFVGLGGSGKSVLMRIRKQFYDRFASLGPRFDKFARFVFIDTDRGEFAPKNQKNGVFADVMPRESEIVESTITRARFQEIFDNLELHVKADHLHWLKPSMRTVGPGAVEDGAGTHRQFGRLAFFENYAAIRQQIKAQIEEVLAYASRNPTKVAQQRIEVVIVTSLAGGTGSGMFLDVAYLVRHLLSHTDYERLRIKHVTLVAFLPEIFGKTPAGAALLPRLRQNAYAALLELEYYGTPRTGDALYLGEEAGANRDGGHGFRATWPGEGEVFFADRGWDTLFLVDNVNNLTQSDPLTDSAVFQMTADYLFLDFGQSRFASEKRTARSNLVQYKDRWKGTWVSRLPDPALPQGAARGPENIFATQNGCIYSSFGLAEIFFDLDNLYQVAGYRLASRLVQLRWIGPAGELAPEAYQERADRDLLHPPRLDDQAEPPPSFHPDAIARRAVVLEDRDWLAMLEADFDAIEELEGDMAADGLASAVERHRGRLEISGDARKTIHRNATTWAGTAKVLGPWRQRLKALADAHLSEDGAEATRKLLVEYRALLLEVRRDLVEAGAVGPLPPLLSRLEEARSVPFPVRPVALRIELARACVAARAEFRARYAAVARANAEAALLSAISYVGEPGKGAPGGIATDEHGTLQEWIDFASGQLQAISNRLQERFEVAKVGPDRGDHRKQSLTVVWDEGRFDRKINQALLLFDKVGRDPAKPEGNAGDGDPAQFAFEFHWANLDRLVRDELRRADGLEASADSLAGLLQHYKDQRMFAKESIDKIAQRLAEACEKVIRAAGLRLADVEHGNVADLLCIAKTPREREQMVERLVLAAAPYLPTAERQGEAIPPAHHNLFGLSVGNTATSPANVQAIADMVETVASARQAGGVAGFGERLEAEQSSALFVRMMAGFPLQDYTRLEDLYKAYKDPATNTRSNDECHIDFKQSWEDLPDIRAVKSKTYSQIREYVDIVLLNMMIGTITYPKDRAAFYVLIPDPYGAGEDYHRLGKRISRAIKHACDDRTIREDLAGRWSQWSAGATVKAWACLYASGLKTWEESRREIAVEAGRVEIAPFRTCYGGLLRMIGKKLSEVEGGRAWLEALKPPLADGAGEVPPRPAVVGMEAALKRIHEHLMIYQVIPARVESVSLAQPDAVAPPA